MLNCDLDCPFGHTTDSNGCPECCCVSASCNATDADCCPGYRCSNYSVCGESCFQCADEKKNNEIFRRISLFVQMYVYEVQEVRTGRGWAAIRDVHCSYASDSKELLCKPLEHFR